jgi:hypothetical protein
MMTVIQRIQSIDNHLTINPADNYESELTALKGVEGDLPVYQHMGTPVWKIQEAKQEIKRIRAWIKEELENNQPV